MTVNVGTIDRIARALLGLVLLYLAFLSGLPLFEGGLMKILAYLLQTSVDWGDAEVRIKIVVPNEAAAEGVATNLNPLVDRLRTGATLDVIRSQNRPFDEILRTSSADADIVFMGMAAPMGVEDYATYYERLRSRTDGMPTTVFVLAAEDIGFEDVLA